VPKSCTGAGVSGYSARDKRHIVQVNLNFEGADIAMPALGTGYPALVSGRADGIVAFVEGGGTRQERDGQGDAAIITQLAELGIGYDGVRASAAGRATALNDVVAQGGSITAFVVYLRSADSGLIAPENRIADLRIAAGGVIDPAAGGVGIIGTESHIGQDGAAAENVDPAASISKIGTEGQVGQDGEAGLDVDPAATGRPIGAEGHPGQERAARFNVHPAATDVSPGGIKGNIGQGRAARFDVHPAAILTPAAFEGNIGQGRAAGSVVDPTAIFDSQIVFES
jgi:hypothetical protein